MNNMTSVAASNRLNEKLEMHINLSLFFNNRPFNNLEVRASIAEKKEFIELLKTLPHKGEFLTDDAVKTAGPYLPVLFVLTEKDIETYDIYPFAVISRELCDDKEHRRYATSHFAEIRHPIRVSQLIASLLAELEDSPASATYWGSEEMLPTIWEGHPRRSFRRDERAR
jgi:hypothetical protein